MPDPNAPPGFITQFATFATALAAVAGAAIAVTQRFTTYRDKVAASHKAFDDVVASLASEKEIDRLAGAILLRRFFDPDSEVNPPVTVLARVLGWTGASKPPSAGSKKPAGVNRPPSADPNPSVSTDPPPDEAQRTECSDPAPKREASNRAPEDEPINGDYDKRTPYAREAVNVIAAILRSQPSGNFQKLLADGLAFAPHLRRADLQRTNLHYAYLGWRGERRILDMRQADFYRADLTGATLKNAIARGAVFYQARMTDAVLKESDLRGASFYEADLSGAIFDGAILEGATFAGARNVPGHLRPYIGKKKDKDDCWVGPTRVPESPSATPGASVVYLSKPGCLDAHQEKIVALVRGWLESSGLATVTLERDDYPATSALSELRRRISGCAGAIVFGFAELTISDGLWRSGTSEEAKASGRALPTPWSQIEAGMAAMKYLPLLLIAEPEVAGGVFDRSWTEHNLFRLAIPPSRLSTEFKNWLVAVNARAARFPPEGS